MDAESRSLVTNPAVCVMGWYTHSGREYDRSGKIHLSENWREVFQGVVNDDYMSGRNEITGLSA